MSNYMEEAFGPVEHQYRQEVLANTWGHLAPKQDKTYKGHVIWALGCFGSDNLNPTVLECKFRGLASSPWFYDHLVEFLAGKSKQEGAVFKFTGEFKNYHFTGKIERLHLTPKTA